MRMKLKYCGMTRRQDVEQAVSLGVDAIGLIFYGKSPRYITVDDAAAISVDLPPFVSRVGVFVNAQPQLVKQAIKQVGLDYCQFHGEESLAYCEQFNHPYIKAIRVKTKHCISDAIKNYPSAAALLLDSWVEGLHGGSGEAFDWSYLTETETNMLKPLILAGGINADTIEQALAQSCYALDICSGIEQHHGIKSIDLMKQIAQKVWSYYD